MLFGSLEMGVIFNKKRTLRSYLSLLKMISSNSLIYLPYRLTASRRKLPDFLILGAMKGGTTSLFHYLSQHPEIEVSRTQEIHYFSKKYKRSINYYKSFFPKTKTNKITGESSPYYLFHPQVPKRVKETIPDVKLIVLLRNPADRAYSHYNMHKGIDTSINFREALDREKERVFNAHNRMRSDPNYNNLNHQAYSYTKRGMYFEQVSRWLSYFDKDQILFIKSEQFFDDPKAILKKVYDHLQIGEVYPTDLKPKNQRPYEKLDAETDQYLKQCFEKDSLQLQTILGEEFYW